jgi:cell division FtsZ-interacting protein ZapD
MSKDLSEKMTQFTQNVKRIIEKLYAEHEDDRRELRKELNEQNEKIKELLQVNEFLQNEVHQLQKQVDELKAQLTVAEEDYAFLCLRQLPGQINTGIDVREVISN